MTPSAAHPDLGLYVHIPFCLRKCAYCAFFSRPIGKYDPKPILDCILREFDLYAPAEPVSTLYIGGGTPTCLPEDLLCTFIDALVERVGWPEEFTVESNPIQADTALFKSLRNCGVNRLSIGAQSFNSAELKTLGRPHTSEAIGQAVAAARDAGFENIGLDLIFGIPGQTIQTFARSLAKAIALEPTHLSAYSLTWEKETRLTRALRMGFVQEMDEDDERAMYKQLCRTLAGAGYQQYEISNFAKPGFACRHNSRYWRNQPVIGLGPAAAGWYRGHRTANIAGIEAYIKRITNDQFAWETDVQPTDRQIAAEMAVLGLRMTEGIDLAAFEAMTGKNPRRLFANPIKEHCRDGLLELTSTHLRLTEKGLSFADTVSCDFIL